MPMRVAGMPGMMVLGVDMAGMTAAQKQRAHEIDAQADHGDERGFAERHVGRLHQPDGRFDPDGQRHHGQHERGMQNRQVLPLCRCRS